MLHIRTVGLLAIWLLLAASGCEGNVTNIVGGGDAGGGDDDGGDDDDAPNIDGGGAKADAGGVPPGVGDGPAVTRGDDFFGTAERFNRYYTDAAWQPTKTIFVSPTGGGNGSSAGSPTTLAGAVGQLAPGTLVEMAAGNYASACVDLDDSQSGTYDAPVVFRGAKDGNTLATTMTCCGSGRQACFNLENANYVAIDSIELSGGRFGVRSVGAGFAADQHQVGVAILRSAGHDQAANPFFSGQSDWFVIEGVTASNAGEDDGHGIYLSNGSDWLIVRDNELFNNSSADFQINADPLYTCGEDGVPTDSAECDAVAGTSATGGRGATDFALVERNFFHDGTAQGANFTSVRNSLIRNNVFAFYARHNVSFWQESENPNLGSRDNRILHNLFITTNTQHAVQFVSSSTDNTFAQNVVIGLTRSGGGISANANALLMECDSTVSGNTYEKNIYVSGRFEGFTPGAGELRETTVSASWFAAFPAGVVHAVAGFAPTAAAPWANAGVVLQDAPADMLGNARAAPTALGPLEP